MIRCHLLKHLLQQIKVKKIKKGGRNYERGGIGKKAYEIINGNPILDNHFNLFSFNWKEQGNNDNNE